MAHVLRRYSLPYMSGLDGLIPSVVLRFNRVTAAVPFFFSDADLSALSIEPSRGASRVLEADPAETNRQLPIVVTLRSYSRQVYTGELPRKLELESVTRVGTSDASD